MSSTEDQDDSAKKLTNSQVAINEIQTVKARNTGQIVIYVRLYCDVNAKQ